MDVGVVYCGYTTYLGCSVHEVESSLLITRTFEGRLVFYLGPVFKYTLLVYRRILYPVGDQIRSYNLTLYNLTLVVGDNTLQMPLVSISNHMLLCISIKLFVD